MNNHDYFLLRAPDGSYLSSTTASDNRTADHGQLVSLAGDGCLWHIRDGQLVSATGTPGAPVAAGTTLTAGTLLTLPFAAGDLTFTAQSAPTRLPSEHLAELREQGFTVLERILDADAIARVKAGATVAYAEQHADAEPTDGRVNLRDGLAWSPDVARAVTHPVALWLMQQYMGTDEIHYGHTPSVTTMRPAGKLLGEHPKGGWHSDYPYHPGVFENDEWRTDEVYGVQFNLCIDAFRKDNAATQFVPGSHALCRFPSREFNTTDNRMGEGIHAEVQQMEAPAGAALIYDARTWHRACDELNVSGQQRVAVLNAVTPAWIKPMMDKGPGTEAYRSSDTAAHLTPREQRDLDRLCHAPPAPVPPGAPEISRPNYGRAK